MINGKIRSQLSSLNNVDLTDRVTAWQRINPACIEDNTSLIQFDFMVVHINGVVEQGLI
jgi:hypothetical protein